MATHQDNTHPPVSADPQASAPELRTEQLVKAFDSQVILDHIDLTINRKEIVAIVGASGSGKTVLLDCLIRLLDVSAGKVFAADHSSPRLPLIDITHASETVLHHIRLHWAVVFQRNALFSGSVYENIALLLREHTTMTEAQITERTRESLAASALDVDRIITKDRDELSGGMAKRVAIARAIAIDPAVLFYDEPTTGLDPIVSSTIQELIWNMHHKPTHTHEPRTTVIVTHDKELIRRLSPRILMLHQGKICYDGDYQNFGQADCAPAAQYLREMPVLHSRQTRD